ncbi:hypothetical protein KGV55_02490 [Candidatus Gracilibacteria bacterium]|nr:hypothetical protein [Candidatus Gracilibacteria bacterium]
MFSWSFSNKKNHSPIWYVIALIIVIAIAIYGILNTMYMMSVTVFLVAGIYLLVENNTTPTTEVEMEEGIFTIDENVYEFRDYVYFAIIAKAKNQKIIRLVPNSKLGTVIDIPLSSDVNPIELREWLATQLDENPDMKLSKTDKLIDIAKL